MELIHVPTATRALSPQEVELLEASGNCCLPGSTWADVRIISKPGGARFDASRHVRNSYFAGQCILGGFHNSVHDISGALVPGGVYSSTVIDSVICDGALVSRTALLSRCIVGASAAVVGCGVVCMKASESTFANGRAIPVVVGVGGRDVAMYAEMTLEDAAQVAASRACNTTLQKWDKLVRNYCGNVLSDKTLVCENAQLLNCAKIQDAYIGCGSLIEGSTIVDSTVLSSHAIKSTKNCTSEARTIVEGGCVIQHSIVQWGCHCKSMAAVEGSFMCASSYVDRHAKLLNSVLGSCSGASEGEISSSLVGPFVGFHHQALLIACYWPSGRGNIGYGANVGSNHTGKAPDQELWPGEGLFFGLDVAIKYPANFVRSPYTLLATGVTTVRPLCGCVVL